MKLYTTSAVAALLGISRQRVNQLRRLRFLGQRFGRAWVFTPHDVAAMRVRINGRPRNSQGPAGRE